MSAVRQAVEDEPVGDVLVFLPGAGEIRKAKAALEALANEAGLLVLPLHGDLPIAEQARAVEPAKQRKVVLATNVAESSVTVDGVTVVVDSGLARVAGHSPWSGLPTLALEAVSRASSTQRAGRAGRTKPGRVLRLYTKGDYESRRAHDTPEIVRSELSEAFLILHGAGVAEPEKLRFLAEPPKARVDSARELLTLLGAFAPLGGLSELGRRLLRFPIAPRLGRLLIEGERRGVGKEAALCAALLAERDIVQNTRTGFGERSSGLGTRGPSDVLDRLERYREAEDARFEPHRLRSFGLDVRSVESVRRAERQLSRLLKDSVQGPGSMDAVERELLRCLLSAFPDRVARRRRRGERDLVLASGGVARLSEQSVAVDPEFLLALDVEEQRGASESKTTVRLASAIEADWLLEDFASRVLLTDELEWNASAERVERVEKMAFGAVVFDEARAAAPASPQASAVLAAAARRGSSLSFAKSDAVSSLTLRLRLLRGALPGASIRGTRRILGRCHARLAVRRFDQLRRAARGRCAERAALRPERGSTTCARDRDAGTRSLAGRAHRPSPLRSRSPTLDRIPFAGFLRHARRSPVVPRQGPAHLASARAQPSRDASNQRFVRLLVTALPEHSP